MAEKKQKQGAGTMTGRVHELTRTEKVGKAEHPKRLLVLSINEEDKYPQKVPIEFFGQSNVDKLAEVGVDDKVTVSYDLRGREASGKWYPSISGWKVDVLERSGFPPPVEPNGGGWGAPPPQDDDGIPF